MLALVYDSLTWTVIGLSAAIAVAWLLARLLVRRSATRTRAMRLRLTDGSLSPRGQHYYFAHAALRALAAEDPEALITTLCDHDSGEFLLKLWNAVGKDVATSGDGDDRGGDDNAAAVAPDGLDAVPARLAGRPAVVICLPEPRAATEAHFVAVVLNHELAEPAKPAPEPAAYYFTLEKGFTVDADAPPRTVLCEWDGQSHRNHGDGPPPDARRFLEAIAKHLSTPATPPAPRATSRPKQGRAPDAQ